MAYAGLHSAQTANHRIENWVYANAAARIGATSLTADDVGKVAFQSDTSTYWRLTAYSPVTWLQIMGDGSISSATASTNGTIRLSGALAGLAENPQIASGYVEEYMLAFNAATDSELSSHASTIAAAGTLGHVKVGTSLSIDGAGVLDVRGLAMAAAKTLTVERTMTLTADADSYTLTIPATGTLALRGTSNIFAEDQQINKNLLIGASASGCEGGGLVVIALQNTETGPSSDPVGGVVLYASGGALYCRGSSGTVTPVAPA